MPGVPNSIDTERGKRFNAEGEEQAFHEVSAGVALSLIPRPFARAVAKLRGTTDRLPVSHERFAG